jgi:hypothetical protein
MAQDIQKAIVEILKHTKEENSFTPTDSLQREILKQAHATGTNDMFAIDRMQRISLAKKAVEHGAPLSSIVEYMTWKDFEGFVASILSAHHYQCVESFRRRGTSAMHGMEIDVIGVKGNTLVAIDAKLWGIRRSKASALKLAAEKQKIRTNELSNELHKLARKMGGLQKKEYQLFPVIVTWLVEDVELHEGVPVVPIFKLNSFILDLYKYEDLIATFFSSYDSSD